MRNVSVLQTNVVHVPHERQERRPHKEFTTACIIHLISKKKGKKKRGEKKKEKKRGKKRKKKKKKKEVKKRGKKDEKKEKK